MNELPRIYLPLVLFALVGSSLAQAPLEPDALDKDYAAELPRTPPREPPEALGTFQIADGFRIELVAAEPLVSDPVAVAFDEYGRMFVVEMRGYSEDQEDNLGVVRLLRDVDDDGVFDRATDYVGGLSWPTAVACYDGGVFVGVAPDILYCKDTDGDGVADERRVVFTGFGRQNVQGLLNSFIWGFEHQLHGSASSNGGAIQMAEHPDAAPVVLRRQDFKIDPNTMRLSAVSGGGQHGLSFDRWGNRYATSNSNHIQWIEFEEHYQRRNPLLADRPANRSIAEDGPAAEVYRTSPVEPWRIVRTRLRVKSMVSGPVEGGGRAAGYFTGATGVTIYRGDAFPPEFRRHTFAFVGDVGGNLVHLKRIDDEGLDKVARRVHAKREFLTSTDNWFRPVQFANGPDGGLYVIDMYREVIEHPLSLPPLIKKHLDLTSGRGRGRVYRVVPVDHRRVPRIMPGDASPEQLVDMLAHRNGWHRETAARLIATRNNAAKLGDRIRRLQRECPRVDGRIRALHALRSLGLADAAALRRALRDDHPQVRIQGLRLVEQHPLTESLTRELHTLARDADIRVRYQLALTLGGVDFPGRLDALVQVARRDASDAKMRWAILTSLTDDRRDFLVRLLRDGEFAREAGGLELLEEVARQVGRRGTEIAPTLAVLDSTPPDLRTRLTLSLLEGTRARGESLKRRLADAGVAEAATLVDDLLNDCRLVALTEEAELPARLRAARGLKLAEFTDVASTLTELLDPRQPPALRSLAVATLGGFSDEEVADLLTTAAPSLSPADRHQALSMLCSRSAWAAKLLDHVRAGTLRPTDLSAAHRNQLLSHRDSAIAGMANELFGELAGREEVLAQYQRVLSMSGDPQRGRELFRKTCAVCHRLDDVGNQVGPDLQPGRNRGAAFMLTNILDPNREVDPRYEAYVVLDVDGQTATGILQAESPASITVRQADGTSKTIPREELEELRATGKSLMPEGLEKELDPQSLADVISYLISP